MGEESITLILSPSDLSTAKLGKLNQAMKIALNIDNPK